MSKNIIENKHYLTLLLSTTAKAQALALLQTATKEQILLLSEIALNLTHLELPKKAKFYVSKKKKLLERLSSKTLARSRKQALIQKNAKFILDLLLSLKSQLSELLEHQDY